MSSHLPVVVLLGASVLWGLTWLPLKQINGMGIDGIALTMGAYGILALLLTPVLMAQFAQWREHKRAMGMILLFGGGANLAFTYALINGEVIRVMVLFYLLPVWGVLGGKFFLREGVDLWRWLGAALAVTGAFVILGGFDALGGAPSWIDLIALLSGLLFAMNNLVFRAAAEVPVASKITVMFYGCLILAGALLALGVEELPYDADSDAWLALAAYAVLWLLLANIGSQWGVSHMEAGRSSIIIIMELITAVISATLIAGERMDAMEMIGGVLILTAALIEALRTKEDDLPETTI
ncbi:DMT family transporter [Sulfurimonas sp. HSL-1656]|uniref:DMT family transporter n=1 Tax=Thiomicrolovo subterrani TaxID=3131934 RepID=UPI0031F99D72